MSATFPTRCGQCRLSIYTIEETTFVNGVSYHAVCAPPSKNPALAGGASLDDIAKELGIFHDPTTKLAAAINRLANALERLADKKAEG